jgi:ADP-ribosylglycohydrolase
VRSRALGALYGLAIGDALGMPTESLPRTEIAARYGPLVDAFQPGPAGHPVAAGLPAGTVTDDTQQALLLARLLIDGNGGVDPAEWGRRLLAWEDTMRARGSLALLGPSTRQALKRWPRGPAWMRRAGPAPPTGPRCGSHPLASRPVATTWNC